MRGKVTLIAGSEGAGRGTRVDGLGGGYFYTRRVKEEEAGSWLTCARRDNLAAVENQGVKLCSPWDDRLGTGCGRLSVRDVDAQ